MRNETLADVACEMRTYFQTQKRNGNPEHRPWHQVLSDWADRIDAAHRREKEQTEAFHLNEIIAVRKEAEDEFKHGNAAAMRKALERITLMTDTNPGHLRPIAIVAQIGEVAEAALAAPPRYCDKFPTLAAATDAWRMENRTWQWADGDTAANYMKARALEDVGEFLDWLFAPAKEGK